MARAALAPDRIDYLPIVDRPAIRWPNNARVAFWVVPNIEHYEYLPPLDGARNPWPRKISSCPRCSATPSCSSRR